MRIISGLAAGVAAMAIGSAAEARPGGAGPGHGASPPGVWFKNSGHHGVKGGYSHFGPGAIRGDRRHGRFDRHGRGGFNPYFGGGIAGPVGEVDPYGNGFFNGGGGRIRLRGGRPYYDYDRAYPYEWASSARAREPDRADEERGTQSPPARCTFENEVRVCRGW
jgi:hypothetical protein